MKALRRVIGWIAALLTIGAAAFLLWAFARGRPQDMPWTPLNLGEPIGVFTGRKLAALTEDFPQCRARLDDAGVRYTVLPERRGEGQCGYVPAFGWALPEALEALQAAAGLMRHGNRALRPCGLRDERLV